jgi:hypothetical protein
LFVAIAPVFALILLGYLAARLRILRRADGAVLGTFVINFALPALVFDALATRSLAGVIDWGYLIPYAGGSLLIMAVALLAAVKVQRRAGTLAVFHGMGAGFSNTGLIGYPIALRVLGDDAGVVLALSVLVENVVLMPLTLILAEAASGSATHLHVVAARAVGRVIRMPIVLAILAGSVFAGMDRAPPPLLTDVAGLLAGAAAPVSLFAVGGSLVGIELAGRQGDVVKIAVFKLLLHPLAVAAVVWAGPEARSSLAGAAVLLAGVPMLSIFPVLAGRYGHGDIAAAALALTTALSFLTVPGLLWLLLEAGWLPSPTAG